MMSTRGCIAYKTKSGWTGVYHHWDSYPTWLGAKIFDVIKSKFRLNSNLKSTLKNFIAQYINEHPAGWSSFPTVCYCHDRGEKASAMISHANSDPLFIEWVYVINPEKQTIEILAHTPCKIHNRKNGEINNQINRIEGCCWDYGHCAYKHIRLVTLNLRGLIKNNQKPNWRRIESLAN